MELHGNSRQRLVFDKSWLFILIVSSVCTILSRNFKGKDRHILHFNLGCLIISASLLSIYYGLPQEYSESHIDRRMVKAYNGRYTEEVEVVTLLKLEKTNYLGGLIKDSTIKWVSE